MTKLTRGFGLGRATNFDGAAIRSARERRGMSRRQVTDALAALLRVESVSQSTLALWENGTCVPSKEVASALRLLLMRRN